MSKNILRMSLKMYFVLPFTFLFGVVASQKYTNENNKSVKQQVESAGCSYHHEMQLLREGICLMPHYHPFDPPEKSDRKVQVDIDYYEVPHVLEIDESKNKIVIDIMQHMEWKDPRIRYNFSSIPNMMHDNVSHTKFSPSEADKIWHPNLDIFTYNLQDWKYLYDPLWYQSLGILKCPTLRDCSLAQDDTTMYANKHWIVTLFCKFDFSKFPMDTHHCKFRQILGSTSEIVDLFLYPQSAQRYSNNKPKKSQSWTYEVSDFKIFVKPVGTLIMKNKTFQNASRDFGFDVKLTRIFEPYLYQIYIPCFAIVIVSMVSFLIPLTAIPGRVTLIVTIFLTITHIYMKHLSESPSGARLNSLSSYLLVSLFYVMATMIEFAIVLVVKQRKWARKRKKATQKPMKVVGNGMASENTSTETLLVQTLKHLENGMTFMGQDNPRSFQRMIDYIALLIFSVSYFTYNCIYFARLLY